MEPDKFTDIDVECIFAGDYFPRRTGEKFESLGLYVFVIFASKKIHSYLFAFIEF